MAPSFDALVESLLYDVALAGNRGIGTDELTRAVQAYYDLHNGDGDEPTDNVPTATENLLFSEAPPAAPVVVDENLITAVWTWLTAHADITTKGNVDGEEPAPQPPEALGDSHPSSTSTMSNLRLVANEQRVWLAITGHGVDYKRVPSKEFDILRIVAARGPQGCIQPDIFRASGQDKRSVPKRTDNLCSKGYIDKEVININNMRTTILRLKRFSRESKDDGQVAVGSHTVLDDVIYYDEWFDKTIQLLQENDGVAALDDVRLAIGILNHPKMTKLFRRCWLRLTDTGCLRMITAQATEFGGNLKCLQLLRQPTEQDRLAFRATRRVAHGRKEATRDKRDATDDHDDGFDSDDDLVEDQDQDRDQEQDQYQATRQPSSQWTPDIPYMNMIYNIIDSAGIEGISSMDLKERTMGIIWRRPLDEMMLRLTEMWQVSQPPHLRHLGIVKDLGLHSRLTHYVYRTRPNFEKAVEAGLTAWEDVRDGSTHVKGSKKAGKPAREGPKDAFGFPAVDLKNFPKDGYASLRECQLNVAPALGGTKGSDVPIVSRLKRKSEGQKKVVDDSVAKPKKKLGRPRKTLKRLQEDKSLQDPAQPSETTEIPTDMQTKRYAADAREIKQYDAHAVKLAKSLAKAEAEKAGEEVSKDRVDEIKASILARSAPGVYIRPPGSRGPWLDLFGRRGRPRNNCIVVFKSPRLRELEWFIAKAPAPVNILDQRKSSATAAAELPAISDGDAVDKSEPSEKEPPSDTVRQANGSSDIRPPTVRKSPRAVRKRKFYDDLDPAHGEADSVQVASKRQRGAPSAIESAKERDDVAQVAASSSQNNAYEAVKEVDDAALEIHPSSDAIPPPTELASDVAPAPEQQDESRLLQPMPKKRGRPSKAELAKRREVQATQLLKEAVSPQQGNQENTSPAQRASARSEVNLSHEEGAMPEAPTQPFEDGRQILIVKLPLPKALGRNGMNGTNLLSLDRPNLGEVDRIEALDDPRPQPTIPAESSQAKPTDVSLPQATSGQIVLHEVQNDRKEEPQSSSSALAGLHIVRPYVAKIISNLPEGQFGADVADRLSGSPPAEQDPVSDTGSVPADFGPSSVPELIPISFTDGMFDDRSRTAKTTKQVRRQKTVMEIVQLCHGVFPGNREMWYPFVTACKKDSAQEPDQKTVEHTISTLCHEGKLAKFRFHFEDKRGSKRSTNILLEAGVDPKSAKVKSVQRSMIDAYPRNFIPDEVKVSPELKSPARTSRRTADPFMDTSTPDRTLSNEVLSDASSIRLQRHFPTVEGITVKRTTAAMALADDAARRGGFEDFREKERLMQLRREREQPHTPQASTELVDPAIVSPSPRKTLRPTKDEEHTDLLKQAPRQFIGKRAQNAERKAQALHTSHLMGPTQIFHQTTGTFSTFFAWSRPRKARRSTALSARVNDSVPPNVDDAPASLPHGLENFDPQLVRTAVQIEPKETETLSRKHLGQLEHSESFAGAFPEADHAGAPAAHQASVKPSPKKRGRPPKAKASVPSNANELRASSLTSTITPRSAIKISEQRNVIDPLVDGAAQIRPGHGILRQKPDGPPTLSASLQPLRRSTLNSIPSQTNGAIEAQSNGMLVLPAPASEQSENNGPESSELVQENDTDSYSPTRGNDTESSRTGEKQRKVYQSRKRSAAEDSQTLGSSKRQKQQTTMQTRSERTRGSIDYDRFLVAVALSKLLCFWESDAILPWDFIANSMGRAHSVVQLQRAWLYARGQKDGASKVRRLEQLLQELVLADYESGVLGVIDFEAPERNDWPGLLEWAAMKTTSLLLEMQSRPAQDRDGFIKSPFDTAHSRATLLETFEVHATAKPSGFDRDVYFENLREYSRTEALNSSAFGIPITASDSLKLKGVENIDQHLVLIKSIARSIVMTPNEDYDAEQAVRKIGLVGFADLKEASTELLRSRTFIQAKSGRLLPGRNFQMTKFALQKFERWNCSTRESELFLEIAAARQEFVQHFEQHDQLDVSEHSSEAETLVLRNMMAQGHIHLLPVELERDDDINTVPPKISAWGWRDQDSRTHKRELKFPHRYTKTAAFAAHDGLKRGVPIPMQPRLFEGEAHPRIPIWVDINGNLIRDAWAMVLRSIMNLLVFRAGVTSEGMEDAHNHKLWVWEIEMVMRWMEEVGIAERFGPGKEVRGQWTGGWTSNEWWYCAFLPGVALPDHEL